MYVCMCIYIYIYIYTYLYKKVISMLDGMLAKGKKEKHEEEAELAQRLILYNSVSVMLYHIVLYYIVSFVILYKNDGGRACASG